MRLLTGEPPDAFEDGVRRLTAMIEDDGAELFASNQVIGEAYVAVRHHYGVTRDDARAGLLDVLSSGLVAPLNGRAVIEALEVTGGAGLFDRLIPDDYARAGMEVLTLVRRMSALPGARRL